jgi:hypothetical protein
MDCPSSELTGAWIAGTAAIVGGMVAGLLTGAYETLWSWWNRPILVIDFEDDDSHRVETTGSLDGKEPPCIYLRVRLRNVGRWSAKGCRVFLAHLQEVHPSNQTTNTVFLDSRQLAWAGFYFSALDVPRDLDFYSDFVKISKAESGWGISVQQLFASEGDLKGYRGTYRFHLIATSDNARPAKRVIDVSYNGDWHNLRAIPVKGAASFRKS